MCSISTAHAFARQRPTPAWRERTTALILRRYGALNRAMAEDGWFNPLILEFDEDAEQDDPLATRPGP